MQKTKWPDFWQKLKERNAIIYNKILSIDGWGKSSKRKGCWEIYRSRRLFFISANNSPRRSVQIFTSYSASFLWFLNYICVNKPSLHLLHLQNSNELPLSDTRDWWSIVIEANNFSRFCSQLMCKPYLHFCDINKNCYQLFQTVHIYGGKELLSENTS